MADLDDLKRDIRKLRDELDLKMHLASLELKDEWHELEQDWQNFSARAGLEESAKGLGESLDLLGEELKRGYQRLVKALRD